MTRKQLRSYAPALNNGPEMFVLGQCLWNPYATQEKTTDRAALGSQNPTCTFVDGADVSLAYPASIFGRDSDHLFVAYYNLVGIRSFS